MNRLLAALVLLPWLAGCATWPPAPTAASPAPVILVSLDGFHPDSLDRQATPTLAALADAGVRAQWLIPAYPSLTFPNHYTMVTGLRPDQHGIVNNDMRDPELGSFALHDRDAVMDGRWWGGEPIWVTLEKLGIPTATMFWPGSEAAIGGVRPTHWHPFSKAVPGEARVDQVLAWLDLPVAERPRFITLYFEAVDVAQHDHGVGSPQHLAAVGHVDAMLARLLAGLEARGLRRDVHLVIVSDHGMAATSAERLIVLEDLVPPEMVEVVDYGPLTQLQARPGREAEVADALLRAHPQLRCYRKGAMPDAWHYGTHPRIPEFNCQAEVGWLVVPRRALERPGYPKPGNHGFDPLHESMRALFVADGPRLADGRVVPAFDNVHVHALLAELLGVRAPPGAGDRVAVLPLLEDAE